MVILEEFLGGNVSNIQHQCAKLARLPGVWYVFQFVFATYLQPNREEMRKLFQKLSKFCN